MQDIWSKLDDLIYELRWYIVALLLGLSLIGGGTFLLTRGETLFQNQALPVSGTSDPLPQVEAVAGEQIPSGPVNINTASQEELESLPGVGPAIAGRIIDYRKSHGPFKKKEDLLEVKGIGPKTFADLKDKISI